MLSKLKKSNQEGFTIIEVMIVLAIAGLIILIVLLAIPALQRNSRNTAIKNDASAVTAGVAEFASNNEGGLPDNPPASSYNTANGTLTFKSTAGGATATAKLQSSTVVNFSGDPGTNPGTIVVLFKEKCNSSTSFATTSSVRSTAVLYNVESSSVVAARCIDS